MALLYVIIVLLLAAAIAEAQEPASLGNVILDKVEECTNLNSKKEYYSEIGKVDLSSQFVDKYVACLDVLNELKYKYFDQNNINLSDYPEGALIPISYKNVFGNSYNFMVSKPPDRKGTSVHSVNYELDASSITNPSNMLQQTSSSNSPNPSITPTKWEVGYKEGDQGTGLTKWEVGYKWVDQANAKPIKGDSENSQKPQSTKGRTKWEVGYEGLDQVTTLTKWEVGYNGGVQETVKPLKGESKQS